MTIKNHILLNSFYRTFDIWKHDAAIRLTTVMSIVSMKNLQISYQLVRVIDIA